MIEESFDSDKNHLIPKMESFHFLLPLHSRNSSRTARSDWPSLIKTLVLILGLLFARLQNLQNIRKNCRIFRKHPIHNIIHFPLMPLYFRYMEEKRFISYAVFILTNSKIFFKRLRKKNTEKYFFYF